MIFLKMCILENSLITDAEEAFFFFWKGDLSVAWLSLGIYVEFHTLYPPKVSHGSPDLNRRFQTWKPYMIFRWSMLNLGSVTSLMKDTLDGHTRSKTDLRTEVPRWPRGFPGLWKGGKWVGRTQKYPEAAWLFEVYRGWIPTQWYGHYQDP